MITKKQFEAAMKIVEEYCRQQEKQQIEKSETALKHEVGCRVKLSVFGINMQRPRRRKEGAVVSYLPGSFPGCELTDGVVTVLWDGAKRPSSMHIDQIEAVEGKKKGD